ncbi:MAG: hypothetical protein QOG70_3858, partial [Solirubrobacteraceae bacterium]|nr:hypothetical protein [Solirubrobacteraceae bacterium]
GLQRLLVDAERAQLLGARRGGEPPREGLHLDPGGRVEAAEHRGRAPAPDEAELRALYEAAW